MKYVLLILSILFCLSCLTKEEEEYEPVELTPPNDTSYYFCYYLGEGDSCFILNIKSIEVDTLRDNLLRIIVRGEYNKKFEGLRRIELSYNVYENSGVYIDRPQFQVSNSINRSLGEWKYEFNYPNFAGYTAIECKARLISNWNFNEYIRVGISPYTQYFKFNPYE